MVDGGPDATAWPCAPTAPSPPGATTACGQVQRHPAGNDFVGEWPGAASTAWRCAGPTTWTPGWTARAARWTRPSSGRATGVPPPSTSSPTPTGTSPPSPTTGCRRCRAYDTYYIYNVTENHDVEVTFALDTYTITPRLTGSARWTAPASTTGAPPATCWPPRTPAGTSSTGPRGAWRSPPTSSTPSPWTPTGTLVANFAIDTFDVNASVYFTGHGTVDPATQTIDYGSPASHRPHTRDRLPRGLDHRQRRPGSRPLRRHLRHRPRSPRPTRSSSPSTSTSTPSTPRSPAATEPSTRPPRSVDWGTPRR